MHAAGAVPTINVMMQRAAFAERYPDHVALGGLGRLADRLRHFARLAMAEPDPALLIADDHQRGKAEPAAALDHLGDAVDVHELVDELARFALAISSAFSSRFTCHNDLSLRACRPSSSVQNCKPPSRAASASALMRPW